MTHDRCEDDLRRALSREPVLSDVARERGFDAVMRAAAMEVHPARARTRSLARQPAMIATAVVLAIAGTAVGAATYLGNGGSFGRTPAAQKAIDSNPALAFGPWFHQPDGSPRLSQVGERPSVEFPPGTTYLEAITQLLVSVKDHGSIPAGATLGDPLPLGKVVMEPADPDRGISLDLRAPFGYAIPGGLVLLPTFTLPSAMGADNVTRVVREWAEHGHVGIPEGATVDPTQLRDCMILREATPTPACAIDGG